jgi:uncharacterized membrane protein YjgN (DUF898 family)
LAETSAQGAGGLVRAEFRGTASEYFGIWIVNILLTIVTIGIYSAWAKVRRNRYFYGNTFVAGQSFDYHAKGKQIFIGRLIVFGGLIAINIVTGVVPILGFVTPVIFLIALPWLMTRGLRFSARVTSYRNVRFNFTGTAWGAFKAVILGGAVAALSFGILAPLASRWFYRYLFNNLRYGDRNFSADPRVGKIYGAALPAIILFVVGIVISLAIATLIFFATNKLPVDGNADKALQNAFVAALFGMIVPLMIIYFLCAILYRAAVRNVVMNASLLDERHHLFSDLPRFGYLFVIVSNLFLVFLTMGLMRPWAATRERRYVVQHSGITFEGDLGTVLDSMEAAGVAATAEYLDLEGFDFGF